MGFSRLDVQQCRRHASSHRTRSAAALVGIALAAALGFSTPSQAQGSPACSPARLLGVSMIVDDSASMSTSDPSELRGEGMELALQQVPEGSIAGAGSFDSTSREFFAPEPVTRSSRQRMSDSIFLSPSGSTDFDTGLELAGRQLDSMPATVDRKAVIFLSDGEDNDEQFSADQRIADAGVPIYAIAFGGANLDTMRALSEGDGRSGRLYAVDDRDGVQAAFADIINLLTCRTGKVSQSVTLAPGQTSEFPFDVQPTDKGWQGLVTWSAGDFTVTARRPNGTSLGRGAARSEETFDDSRTSRRLLGSTRPSAGRWTLVVTANSANSSPVDVEIRVFDRDDGGAVSEFNLAAQDLPFTFPRRSPVRSLRAITGVPIHLYLQPHLAATARYTQGLGVPVALESDMPLRISVPNHPGFALSASSLRLLGPNLQRADISLLGPTFAPTVGFENAQDLANQAIVLTIGRAVGVNYTQVLPGIEPHYADVSVTGALNLKAGTFTVEFVPWAVTRALAAAGAGAVTGGAGAAVVGSIIAKAATVQWALDTAEMAALLTREFGLQVDGGTLLAAGRDNLQLLVQQILPQLRVEARRLVGQALAPAGRSVRRAVDAATRRSRSVRLQLPRVRARSRQQGAQPQQIRQVDYQVPRRLAARGLRSGRRLRARGLPRTRLRAALARINRYAPASAVGARRLLVSRPPRVDRVVHVATRLPRPRGRRSARDGFAVLSLTGPGLDTRERLIKLRQGYAGATLRVPRNLRPGRWQLAISNLEDTQRRQGNGRAEIALTEFTVRRGRGR